MDAQERRQQFAHDHDMTAGEQEHFRHMLKEIAESVIVQDARRLMETEKLLERELQMYRENERCRKP